jgi:hypothetical protein
MYNAYVMLFLGFQCEHFVAGCVKILFLSYASLYPGEHCLFEGFQSSSLPARPSDKNIIRVKVSMEYW